MRLGLSLPFARVTLRAEVLDIGDVLPPQIVFACHGLNVVELLSWHDAPFCLASTVIGHRCA